MINETFGKKEKLKSKKEIELLFSEGKAIIQYPLRLIYSNKSSLNSTRLTATVSVSKRNFRKAVDRNRIKRLLREGYRKNKYLVHHNTTERFSFMFLYIGREKPDYELIESQMKKLLQKFISKETNTPSV